MDLPILEYAFFQGRIVPFADAKISIGTHTVQYGTGAFAGIRGYLDEDGRTINIFRLPDHAARLLTGTLATGPLLGRQVLLAGQVEGARVDDEALLGLRAVAGDVERPQARDRIGATS